MNIETDSQYTVFRNDYNGYSYYKIGVSKKSQTGEWINGYIRCQFKKGVALENKAKIYIRKAWLSFYLNNKDTIPFIFISEFETTDETIENAKKESTENSQKSTEISTEPDPFKDFGEEIVLTDDMLPF